MLPKDIVDIWNRIGGYSGFWYTTRLQHSCFVPKGPGIILLRQILGAWMRLEIWPIVTEFSPAERAEWVKTEIS